MVDPNIEVKPSTRALKRALLTALRCVDPDSEKRPKMGQVVRMVESEEYPLPREVCFSPLPLYFHEYIKYCTFSPFSLGLSIVKINKKLTNYFLNSH